MEQWYGHPMKLLADYLFIMNIFNINYSMGICELVSLVFTVCKLLRVRHVNGAIA